MLRSVVAVVSGVVLGGLVIGLVEAVGHQVFPLPEGVDPADPEALARVIGELPVGALLFVPLAWALGSVAAGWLAARIASRAQVAHAVIAGSLLLVAGVVNLAMIPHPTWLAVLGVAVFLPAAYFGGLLGGGRRNG